MADWAKAIRMLDAGHPKQEVAEAIGVSFGNFARGLKNAVAKGWTAEGPPKGVKVSKAKRHTPAIPSAIPNAIPSAIPGATPLAIRGIENLNDQEIKEVREVLKWWREKGRNTYAIPIAIPKAKDSAIRRTIPGAIPSAIPTAIPDNTPRTRRTYWIEEALHEALKKRAEKAEGKSMADLVNEAIRVYLDSEE